MWVPFGYNERLCDKRIINIKTYLLFVILETCNFGLKLWKEKLDLDYRNGVYKTIKRSVVLFFLSENEVSKHFLVSSYLWNGVRIWNEKKKVCILKSLLDRFGCQIRNFAYFNRNQTKVILLTKDFTHTFESCNKKQKFIFE